MQHHDVLIKLLTSQRQIESREDGGLAQGILRVGLCWPGWGGKSLRL